MPRIKSSRVPAVGYLRRSTDKQEASIAEQQTAIQKYGDDKGYSILRWYVDDAISGDDTDKRLDFQKMIADAQELGDFRAILVWDQDRFGRFSPHEASYWTWPLAQAGIQLVTVATGPVDWSDFTQWLTYSVNQHGKHQFLKDLSRNVVRGQLEAMKEGSWVGSPPYAYRLEGPRKHKRLVLDDPGKARIVQRIFREFVEERRALHNIATRLNEEGIVSPKGTVRGWRFDTVRHILENPAYTGDFAGGRFCYGKFHTIKRGEISEGAGRCRRSPGDWIVKPDHHEAIIDRQTWERAQELLAPNKGTHVHNADKNPYTLSGLLRCGICGCGMSGFTNGKYRYYECSNRAYNGKDACRGTTVREDRILYAISDHLDKEFLSLDGKGLAWKAERKELQPGDLPKAFARVKELVAPPSRQPAGDRQRKQKQAKALQERIEKARRNLALLEPDNIPPVQEQIREWGKEAEQLDLELRKKPPSEQDINQETMEVLRSLYWLSILFASVADRARIRDEDREGPILAVEPNDPTIRRFLSRIAGITIHTRIKGEGLGARHVFERGEIAFRTVGVITGRENPSRKDPHSKTILIAFTG